MVYFRGAQTRAAAESPSRETSGRVETDIYERGARDSPPSSPRTPAMAPAMSTSASVDQWVTELHGLLRELEAVATSKHTLPPVFSEAVDNQLVQVRLGTAASLYVVLQCRNAATAGHRVRVALNCSAWAAEDGPATGQRDVVEIAAPCCTTSASWACPTTSSC